MALQQSQRVKLVMHHQFTRTKQLIHNTTAGVVDIADGTTVSATDTD